MIRRAKNNQAAHGNKRWLAPAMRKFRRPNRDSAVHENAEPRIDGPHDTLSYPTTTLGQMLEQSAGRFGDTAAMVYGKTCWTYSQMLGQVNRLAAGLAGLGVGKADRVLMMLPNCPEFVTTFMAIQKLGAVVVNAGPLMGSDDVTALCRMTEPRLVIALDLQAPLLAKIERNHGDLKCLWVCLKDYQKRFKRLGYRAKLWQARQGNGNNGHGQQIADLLAQSPSRPPTVTPDPNDTAVLQPTGGTTGTLKIAQLTHRNLLANAMQLSLAVQLKPGQGRVLAILPMFHVYGLSTCMVTPIFNAATILPVTRFHGDQLLEVILEHRPTIIPLAPAIIEPICTVMESIKDGPDPALVDVLRSAVVTSGAAPLTADASRRFESLVGVQIVQGYGLTEASPATHTNPINGPRENSIGVPLADTRVRTVDPGDPTRDMPAGEPGEMLVSGPQVMTGYFKDRQETDNVLTVDAAGRRWLHTGDIVKVDQDGFYYVVDRRKDMINCGGLKVYPRKVEVVIDKHPQVQDVAVVGRPDAAKTEKVVAIIVLREGAEGHDQLIDELRAQCREHLAHYEVPKTFEFVAKLPRTALGKLQKYKLRKSGNGDQAPMAGKDQG